MAGGLSEDDPYRGMELDEDLVRPNLRPKNISYQNSKNPDGKNSGVKKIILNGEEVENRIKLDGQRNVYQIEVIM